jgi:hypothetical protein
MSLAAHCLLGHEAGGSLPAAALMAAAATHALVSQPALVTYSDEKVANRDIKVWHGASENGL